MIQPPIQQGIQQAEWDFFGPVALAYGAACALWFVARAIRPGAWQEEPAYRPARRPWLEFLWVAVVVVGILGLGELWRQNYLLPRDAGLLAFSISQLIVWSPLFVVLLLRRQPLQTVYLSGEGLPTKIVTGIVLGAVALLAFLLPRGELHRLGAILEDAGSARAWGHFVPVFLEGVGIVYLFERLRWCVGTRWAIAVPAVVFALAHVPGSLEEGRGMGHILAFSLFNSAMVVGILWTVWRSRDVVWLGIVHWLMDIAIEAF